MTCQQHKTIFYRELGIKSQQNNLCAERWAATVLLKLMTLDDDDGGGQTVTGLIFEKTINLNQNDRIYCKVEKI